MNEDFILICNKNEFIYNKLTQPNKMEKQQVVVKQTIAVFNRNLVNKNMVEQKTGSKLRIEVKLKA